MSTELIRMENVGVRYRKRKSLFRHEYYDALRSISFSVNQGDILGIIGRNGCGKSTLLRVLAGIYQPNVGSIYRAPGLRVSLLTLQAGFDPQLSGLDNALLSAMLLGVDRKKAKVKLPEIIEFAELEAFADEPVKSYSTGMRSRLGFSVAMHVKPEVLLIDETLGVGDAGFRLKAESALKESMGVCEAVIIVSHISHQMKKICNKAICIEDGLVSAEGDVEEVLLHYNAMTC